MRWWLCKWEVNAHERPSGLYCRLYHSFPGHVTRWWRPSRSNARGERERERYSGESESEPLKTVCISGWRRPPALSACVFIVGASAARQRCANSFLEVWAIFMKYVYSRKVVKRKNTLFSPTLTAQPIWLFFNLWKSYKIKFNNFFKLNLSKITTQKI